MRKVLPIGHANVQPKLFVFSQIIFPPKLIFREFEETLFLDRH